MKEGGETAAAAAADCAAQLAWPATQMLLLQPPLEVTIVVASKCWWWAAAHIGGRCAGRGGGPPSCKGSASWLEIVLLALVMTTRMRRALPFAAPDVVSGYREAREGYVSEWPDEVGVVGGERVWSWDGVMLGSWCCRGANTLKVYGEVGHSGRLLHATPTMECGSEATSR